MREHELLVNVGKEYVIICLLWVGCLLKIVYYANIFVGSTLHGHNIMTQLFLVG